MSRWPRCSRAEDTIRSTSSLRETSPRSASTSAPVAARISSAAASTRSLRAQIATRAPLRANSRAAALPRPLEAAVTRAVFPVSPRSMLPSASRFAVHIPDGVLSRLGTSLPCASRGQAREAPGRSACPTSRSSVASSAGRARLVVCARQLPNVSTHLEARPVGPAGGPWHGAGSVGPGRPR